MRSRDNLVVGRLRHLLRSLEHRQVLYPYKFYYRSAVPLSPLIGIYLYVIMFAVSVSAAQ